MINDIAGVVYRNSWRMWFALSYMLVSLPQHKHTLNVHTQKSRVACMVILSYVKKKYVLSKHLLIEQMH